MTERLAISLPSSKVSSSLSLTLLISSSNTLFPLDLAERDTDETLHSHYAGRGRYSGDLSRALGVCVSSPIALAAERPCRGSLPTASFAVVGKIPYYDNIHRFF